MRQLLLLLVTFWLFSCEDDAVPEDCVADMLQQHNMVAYTGQEGDTCADFLTLYEFFGKQYFQLGNPCAQMVFNPVDCSGENFCKDASNNCADSFLKLARYKGIVGIQLSE